MTGTAAGRGAPSAYEAWVVRLRAWGADPRTDLKDLPPLSVESLPPDAFQRLFRHVGQAIDQMMQGWNSQLTRAMSAARTTHEQRVALVDARRTLAHRLELARHPGLPQEVRDLLMQGAEADIRAIQQQLVDNVARRQPGASLTWDHEQELQLLHECALTAVLDPLWQAETQAPAVTPSPTSPPAGRTVAPPPAPSSAQPLPPLMGSVRRRVVM